MRKHFFWLPIAFLLSVPLFTVRAQAQITSSPLDAVALSADETLLVSGGRDNAVRLWNPLNGELRGMLTGHTAWVTRVAISPDGSRIASASQDTTVRLWDVRTLSPLATLTQHTGSVTGVDFSPDGHLLATVSLDGTIWLGEASTGAKIAQLPNFGGAVWSVAFSHDGRRLATGSADGTIWLWGLYDNSIMRLDGHSGPVTALNFSADDSRLASSSWDRTARVWDVEGVPPAPAKLLLTLAGHDAPVTAAGFTRAGIVTTALDGTLHIWDADSGQLLRVMPSGASSISSAAFSADGSRVVTAGTEGIIEQWDMQPISPQEVAVAPTAVPVATLPPQPTLDPLTVLPVFTPPPLPTRLAIVARPTVPPNSAAVVTPPPPNRGTMLSLPTVNVYVGITTFPLDGESWAIDPWEKRAGHLEGTAWFDSIGNIVLGGHSSYPNGRPGIFAGLYQLNIGDPIIVSVNGGERRYVVTSKYTVRYDDLAVAYPTADSRLTLITCDLPSYDSTSQTYTERLVVVAVPG
jgi:LPXTG-site transpeptidase (sortase) family protein